MRVLGTVSGFTRHLSRRRRRQGGVVLVLMLLGAAAEMMTLGAVIPFLSIMLGAAESARFAFLEPVFLAFGWNGSDPPLLPMTLLFAAVALFAGIVRIVLTWASNYFVFGLGNDLATGIYRTILLQPHSYHLRHSSSDVLGLIGKIQLVINNVIFHAMRAVISISIAACILTVLLIIEPAVAFSALIGIGSVFVGVRLLSSRYLKRNSRIVADMQSKRVQVVQEGIGGIREVLIDHAEPVFADKFQRLDQAFQTANVINTSIGRSPRYAVEALGMIIIAFVAYFLIGQAGTPETVLPTLGLLALGAQRLLPLMQDIYQAWANITGNQQSVRDVVELLDLPVDRERLNPETGAKLQFSRDIRFENVSFHYQADDMPVIDGVSLVIPRGSTLGLIGKTGCGKSTLVDLVMGLLEPVGGAIRIDGEILSRSNISSWHRRIAHVPQTIFLQDASIAENIAFGIDAVDFDMERIRNAAASAQIAPFIDALPEGYETTVGENGVRLSGGQRQRIGIARALYKNTDLLILDEATSALDTETETAVMEAVKQLSADITIIIIAHRLSTLLGCDKVVKLDRGRIVSEGAYADIVKWNDKRDNESSGVRIAMPQGDRTALDPESPTSHRIKA